MKIIDRIEGIYHFIFDKPPVGIPVFPPKSRRDYQNHLAEKTRVAVIPATKNLRSDIEQAISLIGPLPQIIKRGDKVLLKPNCNSPDPPPASTEPSFLKAVIEILREAGANVTVGDSSGAMWRPTRNTLGQLGLYQLGNELGIPVIAFEEKDNQWVKIEINGRFLKYVTIARAAYEADKLIYLPCLKTHSLAGFSGAIKLAFGCVHPGERRAYHGKLLQQKLAEVNLWRQPDLIIMDGRKAFISGGPYKGQITEPGLILASTDQIAIDVEAVKILVKAGATSLPGDPWTLPQIDTAIKAGLGNKFPEKQKIHS